MSRGHKYAPPLGRGASLEAAGIVRSRCHALYMYPLGACLSSTNRNHTTPKSHHTMHGKYCCKLQCEPSAAADAARLPRRGPTSAWPGGGIVHARTVAACRAFSLGLPARRHLNVMGSAASVGRPPTRRDLQVVIIDFAGLGRPAALHFIGYPRRR
jgi:hypothetical protein